MRQTVAAVRRMEWRDWPVLAEAWLALWRAERELRSVGRAERLARQRATREPAAAAAPLLSDEIDRLDRLVRWAGRLHPLRPRCLHHSLALRRLLARRGVPVRLRLGVRRDGPDLAAHAWLEVAGRPFGVHGQSAERFEVLEPAVPERR